MHGIKVRPKRYRSAITAFLEQYHDDGIHNTESFIYVLRTYYTLTAMLRRPAGKTKRGSKYHEPWVKDGSEYGGDVHEDIEEECTSKDPDSDYDGNTFSGDDKDDEESDPETEAKKEAVQAASGKRFTRGQKRTLEAASGDEKGSRERVVTAAEGDGGNKKTKT
jgi:hypothetical protein